MRKMPSLLAGAALAATLAFQPAAAQDALPISAIEIDANITGIGSREAMEYWRGLPADLEEAILRELFDTIGPEGLTLVVSVDELALAEAFASEFQSPNARLAGQVQLFTAAGEPVGGAWDVAATARQAEALLPEGVDVEVVMRTGGEFYQAVVGAFARGVAEAVQGQAALAPAG